MSFLPYLVLFLPCAVNLSFSACAAWCFRKYPRPPVWVIIFLLILGVGTIRLAFMGAFGYTTALFTLPSAILCIVQALALILRRYFGTGRWKSWGIPLLLVLPVIIWVDLRFSVIVVDVDGTPVEVDTSQIWMQTWATSIFSGRYSTFDYGCGNRLKKGVVYFGFCQWVTHRDNWVIWGQALPYERVDLRSEEVVFKANWANWPLRITVHPKTP
jgi:hypothetical protein